MYGPLVYIIYSTPMHDISVLSGLKFCRDDAMLAKCTTSSQSIS